MAKRGETARGEKPINYDLLTLVTYPGASLRKRAAAIAQVNDDVRAAIQSMLRIMRENEGIGLAAPQVGLSWRLFIVDIPAKEGRTSTGTAESPPTATDGLAVYINPLISKPTGPVEPFEEGCLSLPDIRGDVLRPPIVTITALDEQGRLFTQTGAGLLARCWQHELDHLNGVLIIDKMLQAARLRNQAAIRDLERDAE